MFAKEYLEFMPEACLRLLRSCPPEDVSTRKELLIATRHVLTAESRGVFAPHVEMLMNERVLVGTGITAHESLRSLAYSIVADLIHHVRNDLHLSQLASVIHVFAGCLNDSTFANSIQTMSGKLLNTLIEVIHSKGDPMEAGRLMQIILVSSIERLVALTEAFERLRAVHLRDKGKAKAKEGEDEGVGETEVEPPEEKLAHGWREIEQGMPVHAVSYAHESLEGFCKGEWLVSSFVNYHPV